MPWVSHTRCRPCPRSRRGPPGTPSASPVPGAHQHCCHPCSCRRILRSCRVLDNPPAHTPRHPTHAPPPCAQKTPSPRVARPAARAHSARLSAHTLPTAPARTRTRGIVPCPLRAPHPVSRLPRVPCYADTSCRHTRTHRRVTHTRPCPAPPGVSPRRGPTCSPRGPGGARPPSRRPRRHPRPRHRHVAPAPAPPPRTTAPGSLRAAGGLCIPACPARRRAEGRSGCYGGRCAAASRERAPRSQRPAGLGERGATRPLVSCQAPLRPPPAPPAPQVCVFGSRC